MIISSGHTGVHIDLGNNKSGMKLQVRERGQDWKNYLVNGRVVKSPVDIDALPPGEQEKSRLNRRSANRQKAAIE